MTKRARSVAGVGAAAVLAGSLGLLGASAANADTYGPFFWMHTTADPTDAVTVSVPAGGDLFVTGPADGLSVSDGVEYIIDFAKPDPTPPPPSGGGIGSGGGMGNSPESIIVEKVIPDTGAAWSVQLTVPATTPPADTYMVCVWTADVGVNIPNGDLGCESVTVLPAPTDTSTPTPSATPSASPSSSSTPSTPASTTPSTPASTQPTPAVKLASTTSTPGGTVSFTGSGFTPGEKVNVIAHSTPVLLGSVTANASGAVSGSVRLPASFPVGAHTLELQGVTSGAAVSASFTVGTVPSAATDMVPRTTGTAQGAALLVLLAAVVMGGLVWRRRRATS